VRATEPGELSYTRALRHRLYRYGQLI
jgi:hypothetical protein